MVQAVAAPGATVHTDGSNVYDTLDALGFDHHNVIHSIGECVRDGVHTNTVENFWSLLKRTYIGTYHYMSPHAPLPLRGAANLPLQPPPVPCH